MKIAEFSDSFLPVVDGVGTVVLNYANQLADKGHECYVMAPMTDTGYRGGYKFELVEFNSVGFQNSQYKLGVPVVDAGFNYRLRRLELDIIHAHSPFVAGQSAHRFAKKKNIPLVGTFHSKYKDDLLQATGMNSVAYVGTKVVVDFYNKCDEVWTVSDSSAETLRSYGYKKEIFVMPNGTGEGYFTSVCKGLAQARFGLGKRPVFLYVGQMNWKKNLERTLLAAAQLSEKGYDFDLIFVGQGPHTEEVKMRAAILGLTDKTIFAGHIFDSELLAGLYRCADLFVFPSLYDTAGLVVREAAQNGTASVVVAGSGPAEVIEDGVNGFLCEDETEDLERIMEFAINNPEKMESVGQQAMRTIPASWDGIIEQVLERYQYLVDEKKNRKSVVV